MVLLRHLEAPHKFLWKTWTLQCGHACVSVPELLQSSAPVRYLLTSVTSSKNKDKTATPSPVYKLPQADTLLKFLNSINIHALPFVMKTLQFKS